MKKMVKKVEKIFQLQIDNIHKLIIDIWSKTRIVVSLYNIPIFSDVYFILVNL